MLNAIKETKPLISFTSNVFNMICPCKIRWYNNSKVFEVLTLLIHCGRRLILLQPFFFPISYYFLQAYIWFSRDSKLACDCLAISLWPTSRDLDYHWAPGRMSCKSKSRCRLHRGMHYNKTYAYSLDNKIWCSTVSKAFVRSKNTAPHSLPCSSLRRSGQSLPKSKLFSWEAFIGNQEVV